MKSKSPLTVPNKPPFLIDGHHCHKIWHRITFCSSKQHENPKIKRTLTGKRCCCPLCSFCSFSFPVLKTSAGLSFPVTLYNIPVPLKYRKYLLTHSTMKLLLLQMDFSINISPRSQVWSTSRQPPREELLCCCAAAVLLPHLLFLLSHQKLFCLHKKSL